MGNLPSPQILQAIAGLSDAQAADYCRVSPETYRRWKADRRPNLTALHLLALRAGWCPWPGWEAFLYCQADGKLYHDDLRDGWEPGDLLRLHWQESELQALRRENIRLQAALRAAEAGQQTSNNPTDEATECPVPIEFYGQAEDSTAGLIRERSAGGRTDSGSRFRRGGSEARDRTEGGGTQGLPASLRAVTAHQGQAGRPNEPITATDRPLPL